MRALLAAAVGAAALAAAGSAAPAAGPIVSGVAGVDPITGERVSLDRWRGRPVAVNAWASWCAGCRDEAAALRRLARAHPGSLLGIDFKDSRAGARLFYRRYGFSHPSIFDPKGKLVFRIRAIGLPATVFLDRDHRIAHSISGAATFAQLSEGWRRARRTTRR